MDYKGNQFDQVWQIKYVFRRFFDGKVDDYPHWKIYGSVQDQRFDPLAFSKQAGDYPAGGTSKGARWQAVLGATNPYQDNLEAF